MSPKYAFMAVLLTFTIGAHAETIGISKREKTNKFQDSIWKRMEEIGGQQGILFRTADANMDSKLQARQVQDLYAAGSDGLVVALASPKAAETIAATARKLHKPLVFVSTKPPVDVLGDGVIYVGTEARESGSMEMTEICRRLHGAGRIVILMGDLSSSAARDRVTAMHEVLNSPVCAGVELLEEQSAGWSRAQAREVVRTWLWAGLKPDAIVSSNDEMALGAIDTLNKAGVKGTIVAGIDATDDALQALENGSLAFTILQDGRQQAELAMAAITKIRTGEAMPPTTILPYQFVMPDQAAALAQERIGRQ